MARRSTTHIVGSRLVQSLPVILLATFIVFSLLKLLPGDIAVTLAGDNASDARIAEIRSLYGLDQPFLVQYGSWLVHAMQGDLSRSLLSGEAVANSIGRAFPNTLLIVHHRPVSRPAHRHPDGHHRGDQARRLGRQAGQPDCLVRRRSAELLVRDDPGR